eukprot:m.8159 g.8159  ORF g.8159 m.8159 type:complete len:80 (+) comp5326_c0_seq1:385-624(+)
MNRVYDVHTFACNAFHLTVQEKNETRVTIATDHPALCASHPFQQSLLQVAASRLSCLHALARTCFDTWLPFPFPASVFA